MKTIGMLGGMSWESTKVYYHHLNTMVRERAGGLSSAKILLSSVNFSELEACLQSADWVAIENTLGEEARKLEHAGADCLILCTNTMHKVYPGIETTLTIPFFHIADALGEHLATADIDTIGLLGTRFTTVEDFYAHRLKKKFDISTLIPDDDDIKIIDDIVFQELCLGIVREESRQKYLTIMQKLADRGAGSIALACTEIEMLVKPGDFHLPLSDTTYIHARKAVDFVLS